MLSRYIIGRDKDVRLDHSGTEDLLRWTFRAPSKFDGNHAGAYNGELHLVLGSLAGDFSARKRQPDVNLVTIECSQCDEGRGVRIAHWLDDANTPFTGKTLSFAIPLRAEHWRVDPKSTIAQWRRPTACELYDVLSAVSRVEVEGDLSVGAEIVALDSFGWTTGDLQPRQCI